ncbi:MAG: type II toxin-antitoxin system VapC family toxin [Magnetococcales bacterium]|nr:type II toxin-antitoxin system VapC family toxin [Magnetococcales bacterium]
MLVLIYLETSIISYLAARPSRDMVVAAHQQITSEWWYEQRHNFELYVSEPVRYEVGVGDPDVAARRLELIAGLPSLTMNEEALTLARQLVLSGAVPQKAQEDAIHIAIATVHGMDILLTWNCRHIANAIMRSRIERACRLQGFDPPVIATPEQLLEE